MLVQNGAAIADDRARARLRQARAARRAHGRGRRLPRRDAHDRRWHHRLADIGYPRPTSSTRASIATVEASVHRVRAVPDLRRARRLRAGAGRSAWCSSRRALAPIARLTATAREIAATRDPSRRVPIPDTEDEVAELARTLDEMLQALESSRAETEAALARQRQFVADATHELRTPLTSVLANLELLAEVLDGERGEAARSALRSTAADAPAGRPTCCCSPAPTPAARSPHAPTDLGQVAGRRRGRARPGRRRARAERRGRARDRRRRARRAAPAGAQPDGERLQHTPPGTRVHASVDAATAERVPCGRRTTARASPRSCASEIFERFVRAEGDRGGSFGLGLSIVRAVAESHGGDVDPGAPPDGGGARFVVRAAGEPRVDGARRRRLDGDARARPRRVSDLDDDRQHHRAALEAVVDERRRGRRGASAGAGRSRGSPPRPRAPASRRRVSRMSSSRPSASSGYGTPRKMISGSATERAVLLGDRRDDDEDAVGAEHPAVAQRDVGRVADVDAVDVDHARALALAEARAVARRSPAAGRSRP